MIYETLNLINRENTTATSWYKLYCITLIDHVNIIKTYIISSSKLWFITYSMNKCIKEYNKNMISYQMMISIFKISTILKWPWDLCLCEIVKRNLEFINILFSFHLTENTVDNRAAVFQWLFSTTKGPGVSNRYWTTSFTSRFRLDYEITQWGCWG